MKGRNGGSTKAAKPHGIAAWLSRDQRAEALHAGHTDPRGRMVCSLLDAGVRGSRAWRSLTGLLPTFRAQTPLAGGVLGLDLLPDAVGQGLPHLIRLGLRQSAVLDRLGELSLGVSDELVDQRLRIDAPRLGDLSQALAALELRPEVLLGQSQPLRDRVEGHAEAAPAELTETVSTPTAEAEPEATPRVDRLVADLVRLLLRQPAGRDGVIQRVVAGVLERLGNPVLGQPEVLGQTLDERGGWVLTRRWGGRLSAGDPAERRADERDADDRTGHRRPSQETLFELERTFHGTPFLPGCFFVTSGCRDRRGASVLGIRYPRHLKWESAFAEVFLNLTGYLHLHGAGRLNGGDRGRVQRDQPP